MKIVLALMLISAVATTADVTVHPTKDSSVWKWFPDDNYGDEDSIVSAYDISNPGLRGQSLISWQELDAGETIPANYDQVTLVLYVQYVQCDPWADGDLIIYEITEDWSEMGVTWNNKPSRQQNPNTQVEAPWDNYSYYGVDITDRFAPGGFGLYITAEGITDGEYSVYFTSSDEILNPEERPRIIFPGAPVESTSLGEIKAAFR
ncbi:MAG: DNRLRE domain-containing protein [bacterium]|nr:DNRLRE domain-containing protein [bacterium]